ncbi:DUF262 domain-containing protein [Chryseobacterium culicis]|uniref:DUF262 domain-containing protein n=1 Tax=Chryseobacterium culicis TaxID=680127 RepID=UPI00289D058D|nr:DUF262 domain-containing protein [Chryseobacterium culicis]
MEQVSVESITLNKLFKRNLTVPEYQRPYVWSEELVVKFLNQFDQHHKRVKDGAASSYPLYYAGCIVLHEQENSYNIIDGQQRLTTVALISQLKGNPLSRLSFFQPLSFRRIKQNFSFLEKCYDDPNSTVREVCDEINFDQVNVTVITTKNEDQAYNFFETLNTGGVRLSGTDILKAHHLRSVPEDKMKTFASDWEKRQAFLEEVNKILLKARKMTPLRDYEHPGKYGSQAQWKTALTEEFAEKTGKQSRDLGYADVLIEKNTHTVLSDKYSIRQPLNDGENYINYLLNFTDDFYAVFHPSQVSDYSILNEKIIYLIDGTVDLKAYYQLALICCVDKFGRSHAEIFAFWLFRFIYSLRVGDKSRIYESTVINHLASTQLLERILYAYTADEVLAFLMEYKFKIDEKIAISGVRRRFLERVNHAFSLGADNETFKDLDEKLIQKMKFTIGGK